MTKRTKMRLENLERASTEHKWWLNHEFACLVAQFNDFAAQFDALLVYLNLEAHSNPRIAFRKKAPR